MDNALAQLMEDNLLKVWGDRDPVSRLRALESLYAKDSTFFEANEKIAGYDAINDKVSHTVNAMPPDFVFTRLKPVMINNGIGRLVWGVGPKGKPPVATGMDVAVFENGKIKSLYVFLDS